MNSRNYKDLLIDKTLQSTIASQVVTSILNKHNTHKSTDLFKILQLVHSGVLNDVLFNERIKQIKIISEPVLEEITNEKIWVFGKLKNDVKPKRTAPFNERRLRGGRVYYHKGIDLSTVYGLGKGSEIVAAWPGEVILAGYFGGYGKAVVIRHKNNLKIKGIKWSSFVTIYGHLSDIKVKVGQIVKARDIIGTEGSTGGSTGTHLHFEIRQGLSSGNSIDPELFLDKTKYES